MTSPTSVVGLCVIGLALCVSGVCCVSAFCLSLARRSTWLGLGLGLGLGFRVRVRVRVRERAKRGPHLVVNVEQCGCQIQKS